MTSDDDRDGPGPTAAAVLANPDLDPVLAAKLRAWFSGDDRTDQTSAEPSPAEEHFKHVQELLDAADPAILDRLQADRTITRDYASMTAHLHESASKFRAQVEPKVRIPELYTAQIPNDVQYILKEDNTPQALLRDLHRLEWDFDPGSKQILVTLGTASRSVHGPAVAKALQPLARPEPLGAAVSRAYQAMAELREIIDAGYPGREQDGDSRKETAE